MSDIVAELDAKSWASLIAHFAKPREDHVCYRAAREIERLQTALKRIADDDVDPDLKGKANILSGIAWAALNSSPQSGEARKADLLPVPKGRTG